MGLRLLLLLLLLLMRYSPSQKVDSRTKVDESFFKRSTNNNLVKESIFEDPNRNRGSNHANFGKVNHSPKNGLCRNCSTCKCRKAKQSLAVPNNSTGLNSRNRQDMATPLTKKLVSDQRFNEILKSERDLNFLRTRLVNRKQSIGGKPEKPDRKRKKRRRTKLRTVSSNELADKVIMMNQLRENAVYSVRSKSYLKKCHKGKKLAETRTKRQTQEVWIEKSFTGYDDSLNLHAFIVRDEEIPQCGSTASKITNTRYFMCSGVILNSRYVLTTASCVHYAHIYEHHIDAVLSVLIGAVSKTTYVLRVRRYEMHPLYKHNVEAKNHALHNLAILTVACNIPSDALFMPRFPSKYEDVSHLCCSGSCKLLTVEQTANNRHKILLMGAKYIPVAVHDEKSDAYLSRNRRETSFVQKIEGKTKKLAAPPVFFNNELEKKRLKPASSVKRQSDKFGISENDDAGLGFLSRHIMEGMFRSNFANEPMAAPANLSVANQKAVEHFIKDITDKAMERINTVLHDEELKNNASSRSAGATEMVDDIAKNLMESVVSNLNLSQMQPIDIVSDSLADPMAKYYNCPPLGTPIILNKTLIGLVAYTCDDLQSWVPWQYVDVARNLKWINGIIAPRRNFETEHFSRVEIPSGVENRIDSPNTMPKSEKDYKNYNYKDYNYKDYNYKDETDVQANYRMSYDFDKTKERIKKDHGQSLKARKFKNRPFAKEILSVKENISPQSSDYSMMLENAFSNYNPMSRMNDAENPRIAVNKCVLNEDGTVVCQTQAVLQGN